MSKKLWVSLAEEQVCANYHQMLATEPEAFLGATVFLVRDANERAPRRMVTTVTAVDMHALPVGSKTRISRSMPAPEPDGWEIGLVTPCGPAFIPFGKGEKANFSDFIVEAIALEPEE